MKSLQNNGSRGIDFEDDRKYNRKAQIVKGTGFGMGIVELEELERLSEDALVEQLFRSIKESDMGATKPTRAVSKNMRDKYAV